MDIETYQTLGLHQHWGDVHGPREVNGRANKEIMNALDTSGDVAYHPCAEAFPGDDVPRGTVNSFREWAQTGIYAGTKRDIWIYTSANAAESSEPPALMVFNDGGGYLAREGSVRAPAVLDSLIHTGELPPTVAVFVMPGIAAPNQRSIEYDSVTNTFVRFLTTEVLPFVTAETGITVTADPKKRMICGISSGGICAFNAAWYNPEAFGLVLSHCGSFVNLRGGHYYPFMIRSNDRKPIRTFMTSGELDADIIFGSWPNANREVAAALEFAGYDYRFEFGTGGHNLRHGGALFAESLRWLFRE
ncbi:MAG: alpha/beta hydrolase-fold protein [Pseudomonadota bacterium]